MDPNRGGKALGIPRGCCWASGVNRLPVPPSERHDQRQAERMLPLGMGSLGLGPGELAGMPKGQKQKQVLAWWLHGRTTVTRRWIAENLKMGYETRVQTVSRVESSRARDVLE